MPAALTPEHVYNALLPYLGPVAGDPTICGDAAELLRSFRPGRESAADLAARMEQLLFNSLYRLLGTRMCYRLPDGTVHRVLLDVLPDAADAALEPLLDALVHCEANLRFLRESAMAGGSVSAMCVLCRRYADRLSPEEHRLMARIIAEHGRPVPQPNEPRGS